MEGKNKIEVFIGGKVYTILGQESEEYMQKVARYIDKKMMDISNTQRSTVLSTTMLCVLTSINVADDYFKLESEKVCLEKQLKESLNKVNECNEKIDIYEQEIINLKDENNTLKEKTVLQRKLEASESIDDKLMIYENELGKMQDENIAIKEKLNEVIIELSNARAELNEYIENFDSEYDKDKKHKK